LTSLIELIESFKKEMHSETESTNQNNNDTNQNTKMVKCNNLIYKSYMRDLEYDFLDERLDGEEEKESVKDVKASEISIEETKEGSANMTESSLTEDAIYESTYFYE
jgi:hypothetical protein